MYLLHRTHLILVVSCSSWRKAQPVTNQHSGGLGVWISLSRGSYRNRQELVFPGMIRFLAGGLWNSSVLEGENSVERLQKRVKAAKGLIWQMEGMLRRQGRGWPRMRGSPLSFSLCSFMGVIRSPPSHLVIITPPLCRPWFPPLQPFAQVCGGHLPMSASAKPTEEPKPQCKWCYDIILAVSSRHSLS